MKKLLWLIPLLLLGSCGSRDKNADLLNNEILEMDRETPIPVSPYGYVHAITYNESENTVEIIFVNNQAVTSNADLKKSRALVENIVYLFFVTQENKKLTDAYMSTNAKLEFYFKNLNSGGTYQFNLTKSELSRILKDGPSVSYGGDEHYIDEVEEIDEYYDDGIELLTEPDIEEETVEFIEEQIPVTTPRRTVEDAEVRQNEEPVVVEPRRETPVDNTIYNAVEQMPQYPGGEAALMNHLMSHIKYPAMAAENGIQGTVTVKFVVKQDGSIGEVTVVRGKDPDLDREAVRVVKTLQRFTPGMINGKPVNVWYTIPIRFRLSN